MKKNKIPPIEYDYGFHPCHSYTKDELIELLFYVNFNLNEHKSNNRHYKKHLTEDKRYILRKLDQLI